MVYGKQASRLLSSGRAKPAKQTDSQQDGGEARGQQKPDGHTSTAHVETFLSGQRMTLRFSGSVVNCLSEPFRLGQADARTHPPKNEKDVYRALRHEAATAFPLDANSPTATNSAQTERCLMMGDRCWVLKYPQWTAAILEWENCGVKRIVEEVENFFTAVGVPVKQGKLPHSFGCPFFMVWLKTSTRYAAAALA